MAGALLTTLPSEWQRRLPELGVLVASLGAAGVESCSSTPTCPGRGVAAPSFPELVNGEGVGEEESLHLASRGRKPSGTRTFPDPKQTRWLPGSSRGEELSHLPASSYARQVLS